MDKKKINWAINVLRRASMKLKSRSNVKNKDRKQFLITLTNKKGQTSRRNVWHYNCQICGPTVWYKDKEIQMDHVVPVVDPIKGFTTLEDFVDRLVVTEEGWQKLCGTHHLAKSGVEGQVRTKSRKSKKVK